MLPLALAAAARGRARMASSPAGDSYTWFPSFNKNDFPPHSAGGVWGAQSTIKEASAPTGSMTDVTAADALALASHIYTPNRRITLTGNITSWAFLAGSITDVDIIIPPGIVISDCAFGKADGSTPINRLRFRGSTVGSYSGGQMHVTSIYGSVAAGSSDLIIDGVGLTGSDDTGCLFIGSNLDRFALNSCRVHCGGAFYLGSASNVTVTNCSVLTGAETGSLDAAWGFRFGTDVNASVGGNIVFYGNDIRMSTARTTQAFHRIRFHPGGALDYVWIDSNTIVDRVESRLIWSNDAADPLGSGDALAAWVTRNLLIAESPLGFPESLDGGDQGYAYITGNAFQSDTFLSDSNVTLTGVTSTTKSGNTYAGLPGSDPAWGAAGDPTTLDLTP